ncbi:unnamed protein product [Bursaphelenchus okinawaensis]|uniref:G_PROTEIN_RECEP_F1_2 domain-containing protein n=1 Tax=Bursaphelenchus okinawaensis TaxID=465554 RepID=A0A811KD19_9BILA|nr:unnamed protein product [Bursaphelenchus okinawaensis]CAG9097557.1 unnamed protein product [Bursaphelenchus okinawaensis]
MLDPTFNIPCSVDSIHHFHNDFNYIAGAFSLLFNSIVIYLSVKQTSKMRTYAKIIGLDSFFNICFTLTRCIVGQRPISTLDYYYYFTVTPLFFYSSKSLQEFGVVLTYFVVYFHGGIPAVQFFYRYRALKDESVTMFQISIAYCILLLFSMSNAVWYFWDFDSNPAQYYDAIYGGADGCNSTKLPTVTVVYKNTVGFEIHNIYGQGGLCIIFLLLLYFAVQSFRIYNVNVRQMALKTRQMNKSVNILFILQTVPPFIFMLFPNLLFALNVLPADLMSYTSLALGVGPAISPLFDALTVLLILPSFRRQILRKFWEPHLSVTKVEAITKDTTRSENFK